MGEAEFKAALRDLGLFDALWSTLAERGWVMSGSLARAAASCLEALRGIETVFLLNFCVAHGAVRCCRLRTLAGALATHVA